MKWRLDKITRTRERRRLIHRAPNLDARQKPRVFCNPWRIFTAARFRPDFPKYAWVSATGRTPIASICLSPRQRPILLLRVLNRAACCPREPPSPAEISAVQIWERPTHRYHVPRIIRSRLEEYMEDYFWPLVCQSKTRCKISWKRKWKKKSKIWFLHNFAFLS